MTSTNGIPTTTVHPKPEGKVDAREVGWQFVPQYYTFVNKHPGRLHCFYTKNSTFIHGTEGEDGRPCYGQQEIHNKILQIGFEDCKVFIHSVDAQSSANNGIIIQVIGEMSNQSEPWRKFVQTFFLAEQPNGYFVLNDIFRFLKEETVGDGEDEESDDGEPGVDTDPTPQEPPAPGHSHHQAVLEEPAPIVPVAILEPDAPVNGFHEVDKSVEGSVDTAPVQDEPEKPATPPPVPVPVEESHPAPPRIVTPPPPAEPAAPEPLAAAPEPPVVPVPAPAPSSSPIPQAKVAPSPAPIPPAPVPAPTPSAPKTWANLAAANSIKWGSQVAQEAKGVSAAAPPAPITVGHGGPGSAAPRTPQTPGGPPKAPLHGSAAVAAMGIVNGQTFIKGVVEPITQQGLLDTLTTRFGPVKEAEIVWNKACAFLEFQTADAAKRAILASLPVAQGGEGGVRVPAGPNGDTVRITVEVRKERGDRPVSRPRGPPPPGPAGAVSGPGLARPNTGGPQGRGAGSDRGTFSNERGGFRGGSMRGGRGRGTADGGPGVTRGK